MCSLFGLDGAVEAGDAVVDAHRSCRGAVNAGTVLRAEVEVLGLAAGACESGDGFDVV
jgi:hypothetical protein